MASWGYVSLAATLIAICLDTSSVVVAATVAWHPKTPRYESYKLEKGPVFYEAYYPDVRDAADQRKQHLDRNAVLERSFQVPFERFAYSAANRRVPDNGSLVITDSVRAPSREQRGAIESRLRDYDIADRVLPLHDVRPIIPPDDDRDPRNANIEDISKLVRRAISRDLENWNALERYLERAADQERLQPPGMYSGESREADGYGFRVVDRRSYDSSKQPDLGALEKSEARDDQRPAYLEEIVSENAMSDARVADASPINVISESSPPRENIFQPRPQVIRYTFFKKPTATRLDEGTEVTGSSTPRNYGDNLIREEIADSRGGREESVKVTSIEVSELPRHKTRHHHGEWPKRDYPARRHRSDDRSIV